MPIGSFRGRERWEMGIRSEVTDGGKTADNGMCFPKGMGDDIPQTSSSASIVPASPRNS